jgi:hypothetical protein
VQFAAESPRRRFVCSVSSLHFIVPVASRSAPRVWAAACLRLVSCWPRPFAQPRSRAVPLSAAMPEIRFSGLNWGGAGPADQAETPATDEEAVATAASYQSPAGSLNTHGGATNGASESKRAQKNGKMTGNNDEYGNRRGKNDSPASRHSTEAPHRRGSKLGTVNDTIRTVSKTTFEKLTHTHINPFNHHHKDQDLAAGHLRAHDIVHVNTGTFTVDTMQRLFYSTPPVVISVALFLYVGTVCIFAAIFVTFGAECFKLEDDDQFGFAPMLWMSIHAFSTIGFGNIAPHQSCVGPQLVLLVETFVSVLTISAIGGYVVKQFLRPLSDVRFSSCFLVNGGRRRVRSEGEGESGSEEYRYLTFRMVRRGRVQLRHIQVQVQAQWWDAATTAFGDRGGCIGSLPWPNEAPLKPIPSVAIVPPLP